jgi:hypothetical protein
VSGRPPPPPPPNPNPNPNPNPIFLLKNFIIFILNIYY